MSVRIVYVTLLIIFGLSSNLSAELKTYQKANKLSVLSKQTTLKQIMLSNYSDCGNEDCHDHNQHCANHCFCMHNYILSDSDLSIKNDKSIKDSKIKWFYARFYSEPFLDPSLKPPLYC